MTGTRAFTPARRRVVVKPIDGVLLGFLFLACLAWWASSAKLLVASGWRDNGRVLSCVYFTGVDVAEVRYANSVPGMERSTCPLMRLG